MPCVYLYEGEYVSSEDHSSDGWRGNWKLVGDSILPFFEDLKYQGDYHVYSGDIPIEEISEPSPELIDGTKHIASNFGLTTLGIVPNTTYILNPEKSEGYILYQGQKRIAKITDNVEFIVEINPNPLKLCDGGESYLVNGSFEDVLGEIRSAGYEFFEREEAESWTGFYMRLKGRL